MNQNLNPSPLEQDSQALEYNAISLNNILYVYWLRRAMFLPIFILIVVIGTIVIFQLTPKYTALTKILIATTKPQVVNVQAVLLRSKIRGRNAFVVRNEVEILTSRELAKQVVLKLHLLQNEEFNPKLREKSFFSFPNPKNWFSDDFLETLGVNVSIEQLPDEERHQRALTQAANIFLGKLTVAPVEGSHVITVTFESPNKKLAAKIANALADAYITGQLQAKFNTTERVSNWLNEKLSDLRGKVETSDRAVEFYREKHSIGAHRAGILAEQLSTINSQIIISKAERAGTEVHLRQINRLLKSGSDIETDPEVLSSSLIQRLRGEESKVTQKMSEMAAEFGSKHPTMIRVKAEARELQRKIKVEIKKIASGLKNEVEVARTREYSLQSGLRALQSKSEGQGKANVQLRALQREADANKALFKTFLKRFKETSYTQNMQEADARVISWAEAPGRVSYPNKKLFFVLTLILSFFVGSAVIFLVEMLNPGLRSPEDIEEELGYAAIGLIPITETNPLEYRYDKSHFGFTEALNSLRTSLALSDPDRKIKVIQITSSVPEEGKSTLALCLARGVAGSGQKVLLIDANLRRPTFGKRLAPSEKNKGLTDLMLSQENTISDFTFKDPHTELKIMPKGGSEHTSPVDLFTSKRMQTLIAQLKTHFDLIIFDTPPLMAVADARALAQQVDKTLFVVRWDHTPKKVVKTAILQLEKSGNGGNIAGIVLQRVNLKQYSRYGYGDSSYYYYHGKYGKYYSS
ncbi:MAG: polysaccharide biosynthesis tyrosine autokinase [Methylococcales symbiont of Hymedesmia sp. n. MRB-2018]|nr:MAG: polysaccharide biosynthesis tyrosine autokinase [Methylococcales symbiont of Hymedesmia sp. n. MRB-2018]